MDGETSDYDIESLLRGLANESPRGQILIGATAADEMLATMLRGAFRNGPQLEQLLEGGGTAPLGTFSARILTCWCLRLISDDAYWNLQQLRKMRNHCAHHAGGLTFVDAKLSAHANSFRLPPDAAAMAPDATSKILYLLGYLAGRAQTGA